MLHKAYRLEFRFHSNYIRLNFLMWSGFIQQLSLVEIKQKKSSHSDIYPILKRTILKFLKRLKEMVKGKILV